MSESIILELDNGLLDRIAKADNAIKSLGETTDKVSKKMIDAFKRVSTEGVGALKKDIDVSLGKIDGIVNVGLTLNKGSVEDLKRQIASLDVSIPAGLSHGGGGSGAQGSTSLSAIISGITNVVTAVNGIHSFLSSNWGRVAGGTAGATGVSAAPFTERQQETLSKKARAAEYKEQVRLLNEMGRIARENDKASEVAHKRRITELQRQAREIARLAKAYRDMPSTINYVGGLIYESKGASSINQILTAIRNLKNAKKDLDTTDKRYTQNLRDLNREIGRQEERLRSLGYQTDDLRGRTRNLFNIMGQLGRAVSLVFSVSQISQYIGKMVNVRKEMELQQRSLQVLLQNKDKANELWNQTLDLAVKSPFRVKELVSYTKQLAAYRIESDKLFETNKMLADVSAGLGVDMQRLILAFGQVRSASFLRGCLGRGTQVMLYNGDVKEVQDIVVGDTVMGDDGTPRNVKEVIYGIEQMYTVMQGGAGDDYRVNENHIMTLKDKVTGEIEDICVLRYLEDKGRYKGVKIAENGDMVDYEIDIRRDRVDEYFGFVIDGNRRFLLGDGTITHNTELRQFTEAGIPMLEELSKYFTEIYNKSVSVSDVFDMISKRKVTFTDVENVFRRMTGAGGVFFNMQEELSRTTAGMISNLQDSIDIMFNDIGKKNQGFINSTIAALRRIVDNWETIGKVMEASVTLILLYKAATLDVASILGRIAIQIRKLIDLMSSPMQMLRNFKGNIISAGVFALMYALYKVFMEVKRYRQGIDDAIESHAKFTDSLNKVSTEFGRLGIDIGDAAHGIEEYRSKLNELVVMARQQYNISVGFDVNSLNTIEEVKQKFAELKQEVLSFNNFSLAFDIKFAEQDRNFRGGGLGRGIKTDIGQLSDAQKSLYTYFTEANKIIAPMIEKSNELTEAQKEFVNAFKEQGATESAGEFFERQVSGLAYLEKEYQRLFNEFYKDSPFAPNQAANASNYAAAKIREMYGIDYSGMSSALNVYKKELNDVRQEQDNLFNEISGNLDTMIAQSRTKLGDKWEDGIGTEIAQSVLLHAIDARATAEQWSEEIRYEFYKGANKYFEGKYIGFNIIPTIEPPKEQEMLEWQKTLQGIIDEYRGKVEDLGITDITIDATRESKLKEAEDAWKNTLNLIERIENARKSGADIDLYQDYDLDKLKETAEAQKRIYEILGGEAEKKAKGDAVERIKRQISLIKELYQEYQKLSQNMGGEKARQTVADSFSDSLKELQMDIKGIDFTNIAGITEALESLGAEAEKAGGDARLALKKAIGETKVEIEIMANIANRKEFENEISKMLSDYDTGIELAKLDIPQDMAKTFFGIDVTTLDEISQKLKDRLNEINEEEVDISKRLNQISDNDNLRKSLELQIQGYKEERESIAENERKITELIEKEQYERLKTYTAYARKTVSERTRLLIDENKKLLEIEETFNKEIEKATDDNIKKQIEATKEAAIAAVRSETKIAMDKLEWGEFQKTDTFISLFKDLDNASEKMLSSTLDKLKEFKNQWSDMPLEDMRQVIEKINELENALANLNPSETIKDSREALDEYIKTNGISGGYSAAIASLQNSNFALEMNIIERENAISNLEKRNYELARSGVEKNNEQIEQNKQEIGDNEKKIKQNNEQIGQNNELLAAANKLSKAYKKQSENISDVQDIVERLKGGFDAVVEAASALGAETDDIEIFGNMASDIISSTLAMVQLQLQINAATVSAEGFGAALNTALGPIGWIMLAVQAIAKVISAIAQSKDNRLAKEIEKQQRAIERLQMAYDDLSDKIDEAWNTQQIREYHKEIISTTEDMIAAQKAAIAAQKQRKGADEEGSDEWKELQDMYDTLAEMESQLADIEKGIFSKVTAGIIDDVLSASETFVDAWYDAFKETGDGIKGLEEEFEDMMLNLVKRQAAMSIAGRFVDQWEKALQQYVGDDDNLSLGEITSWANMIKDDLPLLSSQLETFFKSFDGMIGDTQGNLSSLQRGISSITEQQADILASYLNSIRFIVADSNAQLKMLVAAQTMSVDRSENPLVGHLKTIANNIKMVYTLIDGMTASHPNGGRGVKVVI